MTDNLKSLVFIALGEASMCWSEIDKAGIFESSRCVEIGDRLVAEINSVLKPQTSVEGGAVDNNTQQRKPKTVSLCVGCKSNDCRMRSEVGGVVTVCAMRQG